MSQAATRSAPLLNKLGLFLTSPVVRGMVTRQESHQPPPRHGRTEAHPGQPLERSAGEDNASFLGSFVILKLQLATMSRIDQPAAERLDDYLYGRCPSGGSKKRDRAMNSACRDRETTVT